jgi:hypothetical protein
LELELDLHIVNAKIKEILRRFKYGRSRLEKL